MRASRSSYRQWLADRLGADPAELGALLWGFALHAATLASLYVVRPLRDELGIRSGVENMQWLFSATFVGLVVVVPLFGWAASRLRRRVLVPAVLMCLATGLTAFYAAWQLLPEVAHGWLAAGVFVWLSVFNMLVVSVFWSLMADAFGPRSGRRFFGLLAGGGSLGAVLGPSLATGLVEVTAPETLLLASAGLLVVAAVCADRVGRAVAGSDRASAPLGGSMLAGFRSVLATPMLRGITAYLLLMTWVATILYFEQAQIIAASIDDSAQRAGLFARMDLAVNVIAISTQLFLTGRILRWLGLASVLVALPVVSGGALVALAMVPTLGVLVGVQVARRSVNYALAKPARELMFTVVDREAKYKGKNVVDTLVYRGGDAVAGWVFAALQGIGMSLPVIAWLGVPVTLVWARYGVRLATLARSES